MAVWMVQTVVLRTAPWALRVAYSQWQATSRLEVDVLNEMHIAAQWEGGDFLQCSEASLHKRGDSGGQSERTRVFLQSESAFEVIKSFSAVKAMRATA